MGSKRRALRILTGLGPQFKTNSAGAAYPPSEPASTAAAVAATVPALTSSAAVSVRKKKGPRKRHGALEEKTRPRKLDFPLSSSITYRDRRG